MIWVISVVVMDVRRCNLSFRSWLEVKLQLEHEEFQDIVLEVTSNVEHDKSRWKWTKSGEITCSFRNGGNILLPSF
jgi:hypothetical protein